MKSSIREPYYAKTLYAGQTAVDYDRKRRRGVLNRLRWRSEVTVLTKVLDRLPNGQRILDVPCGTGRFLPLFLQRDHEVVAMDISQDMLDQVPSGYRGPRLSLQVGDVQGLKLGDKSVDYIFSMRLFNHLPKAVRQDALREFARTARKGVVVEVRFASPIEIADLRWTDAAKGVAKKCLWQLKRLSGGRDTCPTFHRRIARPDLQEFTMAAASAGLRIRRLYPVFWGPTLSQMKLCVLEPMQARSAEAQQG